MHVVLLNQAAYPDLVATAQHSWDLARALRDAGHEVTCVASRARYGVRGAAFPRRETVEGIHFVRVYAGWFGRLGMLGRAVDAAWFFVAALVAVLRLPRVGLLVAFSSPPFIALVGVVARRWRGIPMIHWSMDLYPDTAISLGVLPPNGMIGQLTRRLAHLIHRHADRIVVLGRCMADRLIAAGVAPARLCWIPIWTDENEVRPIVATASPYRERWRVGDRFLVLYAGNFGLGHDVETIAAAASRLRHRPDIVFGLVGGGARKAELIERLEVGWCTSWFEAGYQPREALTELLGAADAHLVTLRAGCEGVMVPSKTFGILAAARPVAYVGAPTGEIARVIEDAQCGAVIAPGDADALAATLIEWADDRARAASLGAAGRLTLEMRWSARRSLAAWCDLVANVGQQSVTARREAPRRTPAHAVQPSDPM